jgi:nitrate reductase assembly molybdenum cofactor insertion protein NarJ
MTMDRAHYLLLGELLYYPDTDVVDRTRAAHDFLRGHNPGAAHTLQPFVDWVAAATLDEMEELYTRSFDVQAITTLDTGYILFGDDYKRGELLANLNREHNAVKQDCRRELADHLPNVLGLIAKLEDKALIDDLVHEIVGPAMRKMLAAFDPTRLHKRGEVYKRHYKTLIDSSEHSATIYQYPLQALYEVLVTDFGVTEPAAPATTSDFLQSVGTEMTIENNETGGQS